MDENQGQIQMEDAEMEAEDEWGNMREIQVEGIFIKHDFDHIITTEAEVEQFTDDHLTFSTMTQTLEVPFQYDV